MPRDRQRNDLEFGKVQPKRICQRTKRVLT
jgi:hypothetical protein